MPPFCEKHNLWFQGEIGHMNCPGCRKDQAQQKKIDNMKRAMELRQELFSLANSFAGDETGHIAVLLHNSCNCILWAYEEFNPEGK